jgi:uncharacterized membrane protein
MRLSKLAILALLLALLPAARVWGEGGLGLWGTVVDVSGNPLAGVSVAVYDSNSALVSTTTTGADGRFHVAVSPGTYIVRLSKPGFVEKSVQVTVSKTAFYADLGTITLDYSLSISLPLTHLSLGVLDTVTLPLVVANKGSTQERVAVSIEESCGVNISLYSAEGVTVRELTLNPGESQSLKLGITTPYAPPRECQVRLIFSGALVHERTLTIELVNRSLGILSAQLTALQASPGSTVQLQLRVTNTLRQAFKARLGFELPEGWVGSFTIGGLVVRELSLNPGESLQVQLALGIPKDAKPGAYSVLVEVEGVNPYFIDRLPIQVVVVSGKPLLRLSYTAPHVDVYAGKTAKYTLTLSNLGDADCVVSFNVTGLPEGYKWSVSDQQGNVFSKVFLRAGGQVSLVLSVSVPPLAEPTVVPFKFSAATEGSRDEVQLSLGVLGKYELSFATQNFYVELTPGSSGTFEVQVKNTGYSSLTNVALAAVSTASGISVSVTPDNVLVLKPGDTATFQLTISVDPTTDAGDYYLSLSLSADQVEPLRRDLHVYVRPAGSITYYIVAAVVALVAAVILAYRKLGRR